MNVVSYAQIAFKKLIFQTRPANVNAQSKRAYNCACSLTGLVRAAFSLDKTLQNVFFKRKRWCAEHRVLMTQELQLWQLRRPFFVFFLKNFRSLILQNTLDVTVTDLAVHSYVKHLITIVYGIWYNKLALQ